MGKLTKARERQGLLQSPLAIPVAVIALIVLVSAYYAAYYPSTSYLPYNSYPQTVVSYVTSVFNGYTETLNAPPGVIGSNVYSNVGFTVLIVFACFLLLERWHGRKTASRVLKAMLASQYLFVLYYWPLETFVLKGPNTFGGGISLWDLFGLITLSAVLILRARQEYEKGRFAREGESYGYYLTTPLLAFVYFLYLMTIVSDSVLNAKAIILLVAIYLILIIVTAALVLKVKKRIRQMRARGAKVDVRHVGRGLIVLILASVLLAFLLAIYIAPAVSSPSGGEFIDLYNAHNFGWPVFVVVYGLMIRGDIAKAVRAGTGKRKKR